MDWIALLGIFGLGSVVTSIVQWKIKRADERNELRFREKREAYLGLIEAYRDVALNNSQKSKMDYAYWRLRCQLVGTDAVNRKIEKFSMSEPRSEEMRISEQDLIDELRNDLWSDS